MAVKFSTVNAGDILLDVHREKMGKKMGNTTIRRWGCWQVRIISVDTVASTAVVSWNGNSPQTWEAERWKALS